MTIYDAEKWINGIMQNKGYYRGQAQSIASLVIDRITGTTYSERIGDRSTTLSEEQERIFDKYVGELKAGKPYEYVLNEARFMSLKFYVDENVAIPDGDSGSMVTWAMDSFLFDGCDPAYKEKELSIIDIGTGSGCIAITLKKHLPAARIYACDISEKALQVAKQNAENNEVQIEFIHMDFLDRNEWKKIPAVDLIICNPPYVPKRDQETLDKIALLYEPYEGLFIDNVDPLVFYKAIASFAQKKLKPGAYLFAQIHERLGPALMKLFGSPGFLAYTYKHWMFKTDEVIRARLNL